MDLHPEISKLNITAKNIRIVANQKHHEITDKRKENSIPFIRATLRDIEKEAQEGKFIYNISITDKTQIQAIDIQYIAETFRLLGFRFESAFNNDRGVQLMAEIRW